jgi:hypothetical protein
VTGAQAAAIACERSADVKVFYAKSLGKKVSRNAPVLPS